MSRAMGGAPLSEEAWGRVAQRLGIDPPAAIGAMLGEHIVLAADAAGRPLSEIRSAIDDELFPALDVEAWDRVAERLVIDRVGQHHPAVPWGPPDVRVRTVRDIVLHRARNHGRREEKIAAAVAAEERLYTAPLGHRGWNAVGRRLGVPGDQPALFLGRPEEEIERDHERLVRNAVLWQARRAGRSDAEIDEAVRLETERARERLPGSRGAMEHRLPGPPLDLVPRSAAPPVINDPDAPLETQRAPALGPDGWNRVARRLGVDPCHLALPLHGPAVTAENAAEVMPEIERQQAPIVRDEVLRRARAAGRTEQEIAAAVEAEEASDERIPLENGRGEVVVDRQRMRLDLTLAGVVVTGAAASPLELNDLINALSAGGRWLWGEDWQQQAWDAEAAAEREQG